ncbi:VanZ family protein [Sphaerisporangium fuscum]|uniref:VanZ family protein n=1 Tax=Sphaerisporangium fuscum TaxID=2835868 RepID=UPI001BDBC3F2|nr:VanZ family protein [Sphaerisporangium fuscum]
MALITVAGLPLAALVTWALARRRGVVGTTPAWAWRMSPAAVGTAQYVLRLDRVSSVDDVSINTAGAGPAALASRRWWRATVAAHEPQVVK